MALREVSDEQATRVGGDFLTVPKPGENSTLSTRKRKFDNGHEVTLYKWEEDGVIDDFVIKEQFDKEAGLEQEGANIQLRISDRKPSKNTSRVRTDFNNFWWDLADYTDEQIKELVQQGESGNGAENQKVWGKRRQRMSYASKRMSSFLRAMGHQDRLLNRTIFRGLAKIFDLAPTFSGRHVTIVFEQGEDANGQLQENIVGYKKA